jgi:hypothetical protein
VLEIKPNPRLSKKKDQLNVRFKGSVMVLTVWGERRGLINNKETDK